MAPDPDRPLIVSLGEALIDLVADGQAATVEDATTFHRAAGGAPANVAVGLARLGQRVAFVGKLADDEFGRFLRRTLEAEAVDGAGIVIDAAARTPLAFVGAGRTSERSFVFYHEGMADTLLRADELPGDLISRARVFHFGSVTLVAEPGRSATLEAARQARDGGALVTFDPNVRLELWPRQDGARDTIVGAMRLAHVVKISLDELRWIAGTDDPRSGARELRACGPELVVVTLGAEGAYFQTSAVDGHRPGFAVDSVDATGAGDAFVAAMIAGISMVPEPLRIFDDVAALGAVVDVGNAAGALATTTYGAIPSLPRRDAIDALLGGSRPAPGPRPGPGSETRRRVAAP